MEKQRRLGQLLMIVLLLNILAACGEADSQATSVAGVGQILRATPTLIANPNGAVVTLPPPPPPSVAPTVTPLPANTGAKPTNQPALASDSTDPELDDVDPNINAVPGGALNIPQGGSNGDSLSGNLLVPEGGAAVQAQPTPPPLKENYGTKGQPRIGIQAGHWQIQDAPAELARLRTQTGGSGGGVQEVDVTLDLARRVVKLLQAKGYEVDLLPATLPIGYTADAFVAIHADASPATESNGYKLARSRFSAIPATDDALLNAISLDYERATNLGHSNSITNNMTGYYAFNNRHNRYAVSKVTPAVIIETGYLTNAGDRLFLTTRQDAVANGIADGVVDFITHRPALAQREKAATTWPAIEINTDNTTAVDKSDGTGKFLLTLNKGQKLESYGVRGDYYAVWLPSVSRIGFIQRDKGTPSNLPR